MAKKAGSRKKKAGTKRRKASVRLRKPTKREFKTSGIFKGQSFETIFDPGACDFALKRKWAAYLRKSKAKKR